MKKLRLLCVGKLGKEFCRSGCDEYFKRLRAVYDVTVVEIPEQPTMRKECDELLKRMPPRECVLLDIGGEQIDSEGFARLVADAHLRADELTFVIGGANGVDDRVRAAASRRVSFGRVTYTHQLARLLLAEQLFRASTIIRGVPYHK